MSSHYKRNNLRDSGFTIIELVVVIVVIGILTTVTAVAYSGYRARADDAAVSSDLLSMATAITSYQNHNNRYPSNANELSSLGITVAKQSYSKIGGTISLTYCTNFKQPSPTSTISSGFGVIGRSASGKIFYASHVSGATVRQADPAATAAWNGSTAGIWCAARVGVKRYDPTASNYYEASTGYNYFTNGDWAGFK